MVTLVLALIVRLVDLGSQSLWLDETGTLSHVRADGSAALLRQVAECETGKGPLYFLALKGWVSVFGESEIALRTPSAILGSLACVLAALWAALLVRHIAVPGSTAEASLAREVAVAAIAGAVTSLHPTLIVLSREARTYAFSHFFLMAAAVLAVPAYIAPRHRWTTASRLACPVLAAVGASAHLYSSLFLAGVFAATAGVLRTRRERLTPLVMGGAGFLAILLSQAAVTMGHVRTTYLGGEELPAVGLRDVASYLVQVAGGKPGVVCVVLLAGISVFLGRSSAVVRFGLIATSVSGVLAAVAEVAVSTLPLGGARYLAWGAFLVPLVLAGLAELSGKRLAICLVSLALSMGASVAWRARFEEHFAEDWRSAASTVRSNESAGVEVICHRGHVARPLRHYYRGAAAIHACQYLGRPESPCSCIDTAREIQARGRVVLLVWSHAEPWESRRAEFERELGLGQTIHEQYAIRVLRFENGHR